MAAIYSGIHLKLKNPRTPWPDKLKLARFAWISTQCLLPNKEQVLFDWTSHALSGFYNKKVEVPMEVVEGLWTYLDDILHSQKLHHLQSEGKTISLRLTVPQMINERILECSTGLTSVSLHAVLSCCHGILTSPVLSVTYTANYELLVELIARLSGLASSQLREQISDEPLSLKVFEVLLLVLSIYLPVQKQQANSNRVFSQVTANILQPLFLLRHLLNTRVWTEKDNVKIRQNLSKEIRSKVDAVLQSALFISDHLQSYKEEVLPSENKASAKKSHAGKGVLGPVSMILSKLCVQADNDEEETALFYAVKTNSLSLLFKFALDSFCSGGDNKQVCFHLMTKLIIALGFTDELDIKETFSASNWGLALLTLENLLNTCLASNIYNVATDRIQHGEVQFKYYRKLARLLFNNAQMGIPAWYRCLRSLLTLNHHILEPDLDELLSTGWVDADNMEQRVRKAREALVSAVLQTYAKLRQMPKLIEELLNVVCRPAADELRPALLPQTIQKTLSQCLLDSPPSQNLAICWLILKRLQSYLLPHMQEQTEDLALKMFSVSSLLYAVLFSFKTLDNSTTMPIVKQTQNLMGDMLKIVEDLLRHFEENLVTECPWRQKILEVTLLLTYIWVEVDTLFQIHCIKYTSLAASESGVTISLVERALTLENMDCQVISPVGKLLQKLLSLHKLKILLLKSSTVSSDEDIADVLQKTAQFIIDRQDLSVMLNTDQIWDLQLCSVNTNTYMAAHWFFMISNLPLIVPYLEQNNISDLADFMLKSLLQSLHATGNNLENTGISVSSISRQLLEGPILCELPEMLSAMVKCIIKAFFGLLDSSHVKLISPSFFKSSAEVSNGVEDGEVFMTSSLMRLKAIGQEILDSVKTGSSIPLSETQVDGLLQLLTVTRMLNRCTVFSEDYSELFLSLYTLTVCVKFDESMEPLLAIRFLSELFRAMASLLVVTNSQTILKAVHGSNLLEVAVTSLFSRSAKGLFKSVNDSTWLSFLDSFKDFIQSLIQLIIERRSSACLNLEKFTSFMVESNIAVRGLSVDAVGQSKGDLYSLQLHLVILSTLCIEMIANQGKKKHFDETLTCLLEKATSLMEPDIQAVLMGKGSGLLRQSFSVEVVTVMIRSELASASQLFQSGSEDHRQEIISRMSFYQSFCQQILKELYPSPRPMDFLISSIRYLSAFYTAAERTKAADLGELHVKILQSVHALLSGTWMSLSEVKELEGPVKELFNQLVANCSQEQFHLLLLMLREGLVVSKVEGGLHTEVLSTVTLTKLLACCQFPEHCSKAFWHITPQIISTLIFLIKESSKMRCLARVLTVPTLEALTVLLRQGGAHLSNPHHVIMVLGALQFVPLDSHSLEDYHAAFEAIHEALFAVIICYPRVMLKASSIFLNCFYRLVSSVMHEGRQRGESDRASEKDRESLLKCARLVERMYNHIADSAETFSGLSLFMVAQYVSELQRVTLQPEIKAHLTEGIYCILDCCVEREIIFLNTTLQKGVKEVFNELYNSYTHYHKSQRHGEEKYTI
ncbi:unhealthy ribosome biogenesis protein 2 homolog [Myxocyprinus asiaticus]|uniref:unhealthy ribosome biogenesis protein 2 homolog n=1 Tax=Myxocyprinus asiaticus TaxID=70543 RepID=UPI0022212B60|nr:unhealthy ribosome biogenesis protein 2 homolog [Myxocyprinus asiaticus]XP_051503538.1 unhealthy ribosome biogenesis protein 2 homolog [Myxocyprinus asiaticus]